MCSAVQMATDGTLSYGTVDSTVYRVYYTKDKWAECAVQCKKQTISTVHGMLHHEHGL